MKKILLFLSLLISIAVSSQNVSHYKKVYDYDVHQKGWAMVKTVAGLYGFIDRSGKEIVPAIYTKIFKFNANGKNVAMVKSVANTYGFIDAKGTEIIKTIYFTKEEAIQRLNTTL